ncbi:MAG: PhzF family phenazine biosynthesis protein [Candidatus Eisenbacteria bacterium]
MKLPFFQVDAFTGSTFRGNPAGVVIMKEWLSEETMQSIAAENNVSETAFMHPRGNAFEIRWFTPEVEVDLCGHGTLASAFVVFDQGLAHGDEVQFAAKVGVLTVKRNGPLLVMDFPSRPPETAQVTDALEEALGARPVAALRARDLMAVFDTEEDVAALNPRFDLVAELDAVGVIATAPGRRVDFVSRFFAPGVGVPEDPVTGSTHCTLVPYWAGRLGKSKLLARQISKRGGELRCEDRGDRVTIGGQVVCYLRGEIEVPRS